MKKVLTLIVISVFIWTAAAYADPKAGAVDRATGAAALAYTFSKNQNVEITGVEVHLSAAGTQETLTVWINSTKGAAYDTNLITQSMVGVKDINWTPAGRQFLNPGDVLTISWDNTDTRTYGVTTRYEK